MLLHNGKQGVTELVHREVLILFATMRSRYVTEANNLVQWTFEGCTLYNIIRLTLAVNLAKFAGKLLCQANDTKKFVTI